MISREGFSSIIEEIISISSIEQASTLVPSDEDALQEQQNYNRKLLRRSFRGLRRESNAQRRYGLDDECIDFPV